MDEIARIWPNKKAMVWCNPEGDEEIFTFRDMKAESNRTANFIKSLGLKKGDAVMIMVKRRYEYWHFAVAFHKLGILMIPVTHLLTVKDIKYRVEAADVKAIVAVAEKRITDVIDEAKKGMPGLKHLISINGHVDGWIEYSKELERFSDVFERPTGEEATVASDKFLLYFTSGTTGMPKMVCHDHSYPLGLSLIHL